MDQDNPSELPVFDRVKSIIDEAGTKASLRQNVETGNNEEARTNRCKTVNSGVVNALNKSGVPSIVYSVHPNRDEPGQQFNEPGWHSHYVGISKLGEDDYLVHDQTNSQDLGRDGPPYYCARGSLVEISQALGDRFGLDWGLDWEGGTQEVQPNLTVKGKLNLIEQGLSIGEPPDSPYISYVVPPGLNPNNQQWDKARKVLTSNTL